VSKTFEEMGGVDELREFAANLLPPADKHWNQRGELVTVAAEHIEELKADLSAGHTCNHETCENLIGREDRCICIPCYEKLIAELEPLRKLGEMVEKLSYGDMWRRDIRDLKAKAREWKELQKRKE
jgi:hypothetical protein